MPKISLWRKCIGLHGLHGVSMAPTWLPKIPIMPTWQPTMPTNAYNAYIAPEARASAAFQSAPIVFIISCVCTSVCNSCSESS